MADDMKVRNYSQRTIDAYTYHVGKFADFLGKTPLEATAEDIRSFQLHMIDVRKWKWSSFNQAVCGLRFFYRTTGSVSVSRQDSRHATPANDHSEDVQGGRKGRGHSETCHAPHAETFLCDGTSRSRSRSVGHQSSAGAREFFNDDDLSAREDSASGIGSEPHRLATDSSVARLDAAAGEQRRVEGKSSLP